MRPILVHAVPIGIAITISSDPLNLFRRFPRLARKRSFSPKLDAIAARRASWPTRFATATYNVRDRVAPLDGFPRRVLCSAEFFLFRWMPANGGWIKNNLRATQGSQARRSGYHWSQQTQTPRLPCVVRQA